MTIRDRWIVSLTVTASLLLLAVVHGDRLVQRLPDAPSRSIDVMDIVPLRAIERSTVDGLERAFREAGFTWPPEGTIPALAVSRLPDDMSELDVSTRKAVFFRSLLPLILAENARLRQQRLMLIDIFERGELDPSDPAHAQVAELAERYRVSGDLNDPAVRTRLLRRVDEIPVSMALAQAANESGWGTSRFTREANNLFGIWTWQEDAGLVPEQRPEGATYRIRIFPDLQASVRNYLLTLNVGDAYLDLRHMREEIRNNGGQLSGLQLAEGLTAYSARGDDYVNEVRRMIRSNGLHELGSLQISDTPSR